VASTPATKTWLAGYIYTGDYPNWVVPDVISDEVRIQVMDASQPEVIDESVSPFAIRGFIEVIQPTTGDIWTVGDTDKTIIWETKGSVGNVDVQYLKKDQDPALDASWTTITTTNCPATGNYNYIWIAGVADVITPSARIRVKPVTTSNADADISNPFIIRSKIVVGKPVAGDIYLVYNPPTQMNSYPITWTYTGTIAQVKIQYSVDDGAYQDIVIFVAANGRYDWQVPNDISSNVKVKISDADAGHPESYDISLGFRIKGSFTVVSPNGGEVWLQGTSETITWTTAGTIPNIGVQYRNGGVWTFFPNGINIANTGQLVVTVPNINSTTCLIRVIDWNDPTVLDEADNYFTIKP
jgi:hypothetical protein